jgi:transcription elongation factor GreA
MAKTVQLTRAGLAKLEGELETLRTQGRTDIAEKIRVARGYGDLSENSEYDEAKNEQAKMEARIIELEKMLENVEIIEDLTTVTIYDEDFDEEVTYKIVGAAEADPMNGLLSDDSPLGKKLAGAKVGDTVVVEAPIGEIRYKVINITK